MTKHTKRDAISTNGAYLALIVSVFSLSCVPKEKQTHRNRTLCSKSTRSVRRRPLLKAVFLSKKRAKT